MEDPVEDAPENSEEEPKKNGNFFTRYGKIFLYAGIILIQISGAYAIYSFYYDDIQSWIGDMGSDERYYYPIEDVVINPAESNGERYLLLTAIIEVKNSDELSILEKNTAQIIDNLNIILSSKSAEELTRIESRNQIKQEIGLMINETVDRKVVRNLFFTKYVLQ